MSLFHDSTCLGMTPKEIRDFGVPELIVAAAEQDAAALRKYNGYRDALQARAGYVQSTFNSWPIPGDLMRRDLTAGTASAGGFLVPSETTFARGLYSSLLSLPMRTQPMKGNSLSATTTSVATQWLATEATAASNADPTFGQRAATPKTVTAVCYLSRQLSVSLDPSSIDYITGEISSALAQAVSTALMNGSGASGEPTGLLQLAGTTAVSGTSLAYAGIRDMLAASEGYTVGGLIFVAGVNAAKTLRSREKATGSGMVMADGKIDGVPVIVSRCLPTDALVLAPWPLVTMATWGPIEITVTPYATPGAFQTGKIGVRLTWSVDFFPDFPATIAKSTSIT